MTIRVNRFLVNPILYLSHFLPSKIILIVCKGYGDDNEYFTELYWREDKGIDFSSDSQYYDFQIWLF